MTEGQGEGAAQAFAGAREPATTEGTLPPPRSLWSKTLIFFDFFFCIVVI